MEPHQRTNEMNADMQGGPQVSKERAGGRGIGPRMGVLLVVAGLLVAELGLRALGYPTQLATVTDPHSGWVALPNQDLVLDGVAIHINRYGFRDIEWQDPKGLSPNVPSADTGTFRVALLGDSVTFGLGVEQGQLCSEVLEDALAEHFPERGAQVMNFSFPGYCFQQMEAQYEQVVQAWKPDVLILCLNDTSHRPFQPMGGGLVRRVLIRTALYQKWLEWTDFNAVHPVVTGGGEAQDHREQQALVKRTPFGPGTEPAWQTLRAGVLSLKGMQEQHGGDLLILALPRFEGFQEPNAVRIGTEILAWADGNGIPVVDPFKEFAEALEPYFESTAREGIHVDEVWAPSARSSASKELRYEQESENSPFLFKDRQHWSPVGHLIAANALAAKLMSK